MWYRSSWLWNHNHHSVSNLLLKSTSRTNNNNFSFNASCSNHHLAILGAALGMASATVVVMADKSSTTSQSSKLQHPSRTEYKYVICGGGIAAQEALQVFIERKQSSDVLLVARELRHSIPPSLSRMESATTNSDLYQQQAESESESESESKSESRSKSATTLTGILRSTSSLLSYYLSSTSNSTSDNMADIVIGRDVTSIDTRKRTLILDNDNDTPITFDKILIAVGKIPPRIPQGRVVSKDASRLGLVGTAHSVSDWQSIIQKLSTHSQGLKEQPLHFTVVGGGWMAAIVGARLVRLGAAVTFAYAEPCFMARCLPKFAAVDLKRRLEFVADEFGLGPGAGIDLLAYSTVRFIVARRNLRQGERNIMNTRAANVVTENGDNNVRKLLRNQPDTMLDTQSIPENIDGRTDIDESNRKEPVDKENQTNTQQYNSVSSKAIESTIRSESYEAEVHVGSVFDAFSIVDFRTDHVLFVPTTNTTLSPLSVNGVTQDEKNNSIVTNAQLSAASDVYIAGAATSEGEWSEEYARRTGQHAAQNMMGAREAWEWDGGIRVMRVDMSDVGVEITVVGDVDGSMESFSYFENRRQKIFNEEMNEEEIENEREMGMWGGRLKKGVVFCVAGAKPRFRGDSLRMEVKGVALWDGGGSRELTKKENREEVKRAREIVKMEAMTRAELEAVMDEYVTKYMGISEFEEVVDRSAPPFDPSEEENVENEEFKVEINAGGKAEAEAVDKVEEEVEVEVEEKKETVLTSRIRKRPTLGVIWKRHIPGRKVPLQDEELLWVNDDWVGAVSPINKADEKSRAYEDLLRRSAGQGQSGSSNPFT